MGFPVFWKQDDVEIVVCDLCGGRDWHTIIERPDHLTVVECNRCKLTFLNPRPRPEIVARLYGQEYFQKKTESGCGYQDYFSEESRESMLQLSLQRFNAFRKLIPSLPADCLEIGCSTGEFCSLLSECGLNPVGVDISKPALEVARKRYPSLCFRDGDVESLGGWFDAIFAFEVIEHVLSPKQFLQSVARRLKPGGVLAVSTPNAACGAAIGVDNWVGYQVSFEHLYFFSLDSIERYGKQLGFNLVGWLTGGGSGLVPPPAPPSPFGTFRRSAKKALAKLGLLDTLRRLKPSAVEDESQAATFDWSACPYRVGGQAHNLFAIFRMA